MNILLFSFGVSCLICMWTLLILVYTPQQILLAWLNQGGLNRLGVWHEWGWEIHTWFQWGNAKERDLLEDLGVHSFIPLACAECDNSLPFPGASSIPLCYVLFPATLLHQLFFHPLSPHIAIYFLVYLSILLFPNSCIILFWEFYFIPFSVHVQTNVTYLTLLSLL